MAEISREGDDANSIVGLLKPLQDLQRPIATAVIDVDQLTIEIERLQDIDQTGVSLLDDCFLIEARYDD
jgi:hypothetical protein